MVDVAYCSYEGNPTIASVSEAWWFVDGAWQALNSTDAWVNAPVIGKAKFEQRFKSLPPLPSIAFHGQQVL